MRGPSFQTAPAGALRAAALAAIASLALAACGGVSDEDQVKKAVALEYLSNNGDKCETLYTDNLLTQLYGSSDAKAITQCKALVTALKPSASVDVTDVQIDGDNATATAKVVGGTTDGGVYKVSLVKDGDNWKYDSIQQVTAPNSAK